MPGGLQGEQNVEGREPRADDEHVPGRFPVVEPPWVGNVARMPDDRRRKRVVVGRRVAGGQHDRPCREARSRRSPKFVLAVGAGNRYDPLTDACEPRPFECPRRQFGDVVAIQSARNECLRRRAAAEPSYEVVGFVGESAHRRDARVEQMSRTTRTVSGAAS